MKSGQVMTAMVTPMKSEGEVDFQGAAALAERLAVGGSDGLVVCGTTGESPTLGEEEKIGLYKEVAAAVGGKTEVIAGTGSYDTSRSISLTRAAEKAGVDGIMLVTPYYNKPCQEGLFQHFRSIAQNTCLPVMLYNVPGRTCANLLPETVARLREIENIVAVKEASGSMDQVSRIRQLTGDDFLIFSGDDSMTMPLLSVGGDGVVSVASHLVGRRIKDMVEAFFAGQVRLATKIHLELFSLFKTLFVSTNPAPVKEALGMVGFEAGPLRLPLVSLSAKERSVLRQNLVQYGLLECR